MKRAILTGLMTVTFAAPALADKTEDYANVFAGRRFAVDYCPNVAKMPDAEELRKFSEKMDLSQMAPITFADIKPQMDATYELFKEQLGWDGSGNQEMFQNICKTEEEFFVGVRVMLKKFKRDLNDILANDKGAKP